jgi:phosphonate transport system substrate-binding protein
MKASSMMKLVSHLLTATALLIGASAAPAQTTVLRVSAIPDEAPTELQRKFKPLGDYLKMETGLDVQFTPVTDYAAVVEGLASNKIDMAWLGGFTSARRTKSSPASSSCPSTARPRAWPI